MSVSGPPSFNSASAPCVVCGAAGRACARCRVHYYCGKAHQRQHWPRHKVGCGAVALRDGLIVATVDIPADTPILRELPSLTLPGSLHSVVASQSQPFSMVNVQVGARRPAGLFAQLLCVGCCADLTRARQPAQCRRCGLPVCAATCSQSADHRVECEVFQRAKFIVPKAHFASVPLGAAVATLRAAVALPGNRLLQLLLRDQVVCEEPFKGPSPVWMASNLEVIAHVVQYLRGTVGVKWLSAEDLKRAAYMVSMFGTMSPPDDERKPAYVALVYAGMSLRKHSCIPNSAELKINKAIKECVIVTTRDVAAGEFITAFRQGGNWVDHTLDRRESLFLCWGIDCKCERCSDPTELGLYVGSPCCADCAGHGNKSYLIDAGGIWHCESCKKTMTEHEVKALTKPAKNRLHELINWYGSPPTELLKLIEDESFPRGPLHPTHAVVLHAKEAFRTAFKENGFDLVMKVGTHRWEEVIRDQLRALDRLAPGLNIWRYMMLAELRFFELGHLYELVHDRPATEENKREISRRKDAILELNRQLCRHCIEDNKLKEQFEEDPFGGCFD